MAVILCSYGWSPCTNGKIRPWAKKKNLLLIEDSAESCGASYKEKKLADGQTFLVLVLKKKKLLPLEMEG